MARITRVEKARKDQGRCHKCRKPIERGDSYKWFANRIGRSSIRKNFCSECVIRSSDMTTSDKLGQIYVAIENVEDLLNTDPTRDDLVNALNETAEEIRNVATEYEESADAIEEGFGHATYQSDELRDRAGEIQSFADEIDQAAYEIEALDDPDAPYNEIAALLGEEADSEDEEIEAVQAKRDELREQMDSIANDALGNCPV